MVNMRILILRLYYVQVQDYFLFNQELWYKKNVRQARIFNISILKEQVKYSHIEYDVLSSSLLLILIFGS